jgi:hypothetical protein
MGFTGYTLFSISYSKCLALSRLARWVNAPTTGLELVNENIMRNHRVCSTRTSFLGLNIHFTSRGNIVVDGSSRFVLTVPRLAQFLA